MQGCATHLIRIGDEESFLLLRIRTELLSLPHATLRIEDGW